MSAFSELLHRALDRECFGLLTKKVSLYTDLADLAFFLKFRTDCSNLK